MQNLQHPNTQTEIANAGDTQTPDAITESPELRELRTALEAMEASATPDGLQIAVGMLEELATPDGAATIGGIFANDGARQFAGTLSAVRACRLALDLIETNAHSMARENAQWHRQSLLAWQGAGVAPEEATA